MNNMEKKNITIGVLAHVDSGKTTLSEAMLYISGSVRKVGRVDHGDAFLDTHSLEKQRGITIFSKQALISYKDTNMYLLDTPGHTDFSAEMERTLKVLDYAILVINGSDRLQSHTFTLWRLLLKYSIPTFVFVNKMDMTYRDKAEILEELSTKLKGSFVDFTDTDSLFFENIAGCEEALMEKYFAEEEISDKEISEVIKSGKIIPCYFGSALKLSGVDKLLEGIEKYTSIEREKELSGKVFKISGDEQGNRLTHIKITGGSLKAKEVIDFSEDMSEKINQIRIYSGTKYVMVNEAKAGMVVAVTGLSKSYAGMGIGKEKSDTSMDIEPVLSYKVELPEGADTLKVYNTIKILNEEDPSLEIGWNDTLKEIEIKLMGQIQTEILKSIIRERFDIELEFGKGNIVYKETISESVTGVGHYEPLRHYAEVHLMIKPLERGSGIKVSSEVSVDRLAINWQKLIATHIKEKSHKGVLTGSELTDAEIVIIGGKAHKKHTEGGDFRQATYRAIRQGLMKANSILLEPVYDFVLEIPSEYTGRAMTDLERLSARFEPPVIDKESTIITGIAPVETMMNYPMELAAYSKGKGRINVSVCGYKECHNQSEVVERIGYDALADIENTPHSIFCVNGAGYVVSYDKVEDFIQINSYEAASEGEIINTPINGHINIGSNLKEYKGGSLNSYDKANDYGILDRELEAIFERTYGKQKSRKYNQENTDYITNNYADNLKSNNSVGAGNSFGNRFIDNKYNNRNNERKYGKENVKTEEYLLVDGYNVIFAWEELSELAKMNIDAARDKLMDILCNYQGIKKCRLMVVFDAYKVQGNTGSMNRYHNIYVVYTKESQTADAYIEKFAHDNAKKYKITVATSDGMEQIIIRGAGCLLLSSRELKKEIENSLQAAKEEFCAKRSGGKSYLFDSLDKEFREYLERIRLGRD